MSWDQILGSWKQLKDKIVLERERPTDDDGKRVDLADPTTSEGGHSSDLQSIAFRTDDRRKRSEFSLHISC